MNGIYLLLGTNMGDRLDNLAKAQNLLTKNAIRILERSSIYETEPWGNNSQGWFYNIVLKVESDLGPEDLLQTGLEIEKEMGRERKEKWANRLIDIDILYYHDRVMEDETLTLPHPGIPHRKFTLLPLVEIAGSLPHPKLGQTQIELLMTCEDELEVIKTKFQIV